MDIANLRKYKKIQDLFYRKAFKDKGFVCQRCGKELKVLHSSHLKKCGISKDKYIETYGYPNKYYEMDGILDSVVKQIWSLYVSNIKKWLYLSSYTREYITKNTETIKKDNKEREYKEIVSLTSFQIKDHLKGKNTIGVFPMCKTSKFLVFDVDSYGEINDAKIVANRIKVFLLKYFPEKEIHINFSGYKGYHVTLFFDDFIEIKVLHRIFNIVLNEMEIAIYPAVAVEMRPTLEGENGFGAKLPLGVNFRNSDNYHNYAYYVNDAFEKIEYEIEYVLNIKKSSISTIGLIVNEYKKLNNSKTLYNGRKLESDNHLHHESYSCIEETGKIEYIFLNGLEQLGTRHYWTFMIAMHLKLKGIDMNEAFDLLYNWSLKQITSGMSKSSVKDVEVDIKQIIYKGMYHPDKNYHLPEHIKSTKDMYLTRDDMNKFVSLNQYAEKTGKRIISSQKLLLALIIHGKEHSDNNGEFYMTYRQMHQKTDLTNNTALKNAFHTLDELGHIKVVRYAEFIPSNRKSDTNIFMIKSNGNDIGQERAIKIPSYHEKDYFYKTMFDYFGKEELDKIFTRSIRNNVLKMSFVIS